MKSILIIDDEGLPRKTAWTLNYIVKSDDNDKIIPLLYKALEKSELQNKVKNLEKRNSDKYSFETIIGKSKALKQVIRSCQKSSKNRFNGFIDW